MEKKPGYYTYFSIEFGKKLLLYRKQYFEYTKRIIFAYINSYKVPTAYQYKYLLDSLQTESDILQK